MAKLRRRGRQMCILWMNRVLKVSWEDGGVYSGVYFNSVYTFNVVFVLLFNAFKYFV